MQILTMNFLMQQNKTFSANVYSKTNFLKYTYREVGSCYLNFMKIRLYCLSRPFFKFCLNSTPCYFYYLIFLNEWVIPPHLMCYVLLQYITALHMSRLRYLSTTRTLQCVLWNKASSLSSSNA